MIGRLICASATLALLAGCASDAPPPPPPPVAAAPQAPAPTPPGSPSAFDGLYKATESHGIEKNRGVRCNNPISDIRVRNGMASTTWRGPLHGPVSADGTLDVSNSASHLTGQFANGTFSGKLDTPACTYTFTSTKQ